MKAGRLKARTHELLEVGIAHDPLSRLMDGVFAALIVTSIAATILATVPGINARHGDALFLFEIATILIFTVEYVARIWSSTAEPELTALGPVRGRLRAALRPIMLLDFAAIFPSLLVFMGLDSLTALRVFRLARFLRLGRYSPALDAIWRTLCMERRALLAAFVVMLGVLVIVASAMHALERHAQPEAFGSTPAAMWWALTTLTTVGYGDVVPVTPEGRMLGGLTMLLGLGMFALPIGILASGFDREIHRREFVVTVEMVARAPLFATLDPRQVAMVADSLHAREVRIGEIVIAAGDPADAVFLVQQGALEISDGAGARELGPGAFFGDEAARGAASYTGTVVAKRRARLFMIGLDDLRRLAAADPTIAPRLAEAAASTRRGDVANAPERKPSMSGKPGYWIATVKVADEAAYGEYAKRAGPAIAAFGGEFLARGGRHVQLEGPDRPRNVLARFPSLEAAEACYRSEGYQAALRYAEGAAERELVIVEGA